MNKPSQTESAIFFSLVYFLLPNELPVQNLFVFTAADVVPCGGRKNLPVHDDSADFIFFSGPLLSTHSF